MEPECARNADNLVFVFVYVIVLAFVFVFHASMIMMKTVDCIFMDE